MASFDPSECASRKQDGTLEGTVPISRLEPTLRKSVDMVIPMNLDRLTKHKTNIERLAHLNKLRELHIEQVNASRTVAQLKATIRDLDNIKQQIVKSDRNEFIRRIQPVKEKALYSIQDFNTVLTNIQHSSELSEPEDDNSRTDQSPLDSNIRSRTNAAPQVIDHPLQQTQEQEVKNEGMSEEVLEGCSNLQAALVDLNELVEHFSSLVHQQQEVVDSIEDNIETAHQSVNLGARALAQANKYKAGALPVAGALIGGLVGGPIGLLAGFKIAGVATAVGGSLIGYKGLSYVKNKMDDKVDIELEKLSSSNESESRRTKDT